MAFTVNHRGVPIPASPQRQPEGQPTSPQGQPALAPATSPQVQPAAAPSTAPQGQPTSPQGQPAVAPALIGPDCLEPFSMCSSAPKELLEPPSVHAASGAANGGQELPMESNAAEEVAAGATSPPGSPPTAGPTSPQGQPAAAPAQAGHDSSDARSTISMSTDLSFLICDSVSVQEFPDNQSVHDEASMPLRSSSGASDIALPNDLDTAAGPAVSKAQALPSESTPAGKPLVIHLRGPGAAACFAEEQPENYHPPPMQGFPSILPSLVSSESESNPEGDCISVGISRKYCPDKSTTGRTDNRSGEDDDLEDKDEDEGNDDTRSSGTVMTDEGLDGEPLMGMHQDMTGADEPIQQHGQEAVKLQDLAATMHKMVLTVQEADARLSGKPMPSLEASLPEAALGEASLPEAAPREASLPEAASPEPDDRQDKSSSFSDRSSSFSDRASAFDKAYATRPTFKEGDVDIYSGAESDNSDYRPKHASLVWQKLRGPRQAAGTALQLERAPKHKGRGQAEP